MYTLDLESGEFECRN